jgi:hypothetical protein
MKNYVLENHIALQLELKNHFKYNIVQKCNSYAITLYKYNDFVIKFSPVSYMIIYMHCIYTRSPLLHLIF